MRSRRVDAGVIVAMVVMLGLAGCSENFGPPPPDPNRRLPVAAESFAGPVPPRTTLTLAAAASGSWLLGTDAGVYRVDNAWQQPRFWPEHGGFSDASGALGIGSIDAMSVSHDGRLRLLRSRFGSSDFLTVSIDGGRDYQSLEIPSPAQQRVDAIYAWGPSPRSVSGRFCVAQGASLFLREEGNAQWQAVSLPFTGLFFGPSFQSANGQLWLSLAVPGGWAVLRSDDAGASFVDTGVRESEEILALLHDGVQLHRVTRSMWRTEAETVDWPNRRILSARLQMGEDGVRYALLGRSTVNSDYYLSFGSSTGRTLPASLVETRLEFVAADAGLLLEPEGVVVAAVDATLHRYRNQPIDSPVAFAGGDLDWGALTVDEARREIVLAQARSGVVYRGPSDDPSSMAKLGSPLFQSQPRTLFVRSGVEAGVFAGSFGVHFLPEGSVVWQTRDNGQFSYLLENFSGPVKPQVIAEAPNGSLWLGAIQGDGPYRWVDAVSAWVRVHGGLGQPGSRTAEDGLPDAPQVNAFAFVDEGTLGISTWMATFRGGVFRLDDGATPFWEQVNAGLVDASGAVVDSCCVDTEQRSVDVRDLVTLGDGSLLAATGSGAFRLGVGRSQWEESSLGLANRDLRALAVDPSNGARVAAVAFGGADNDTWLFYSEDAGRSWIAVASSLVAKRGVDVVWSRPERNEVVAILETQGAWRVELMP